MYGSSLEADVHRIGPPVGLKKLLCERGRTGVASRLV